MEQMRIKHNETGRSMVEMLGVLAVVGVLSIGGVAGYRYAVDKMNANEIINELKKRAITASQQRVLGQGINLSEYGDRALIKGTYAVTPTDNYNENASQFALKVAGVPERVCEMIIDSDWAMPTEMAVNGGSCVEGANGNTMTFAFNNTLESGAVVGGNGEGNEGNDDPTDTPTQQCGENEYRLADGSCQLDTNCSDPNQFYSAAYNVQACVSCPTEGNPVRNEGSDVEDSCTKCANAQQGALHSTSSYCVWCPSNRVVCGDQCCGEGQQCKRDGYQYECVSGLGQNECLTNADCNNGSETGDYYCKNAGGCGQMIGTCQPATLYNNGASIDVHGKAVYRSQDDSMGWDAAKNFCAAHNMSLFNPKPYCTTNEWSSIPSNGSYGYCTNLAVTNDYRDGWTGTTSASCAAYSVNLAYGSVFTVARNYSYITALCEGEGEYAPPVVSTETTTQTETTTTTVTQTQTVTQTASGGPQICDIEDGNCYSCDDTDRYSIIVGNGSYSDACNACNNTEYKWTLKYESSSGGSRIDRSVCVRCDKEILSAYEDDVVATCSACNRGVDWTSLDIYAGLNVYYCSLGSDSIGAPVTQTQTQAETTTTTATQTVPETTTTTATQTVPETTTTTATQTQAETTPTLTISSGTFDTEEEAEAFCATLGQRLASLSDFGCSHISEGTCEFDKNFDTKYTTGGGNNGKTWLWMDNGYEASWYADNAYYIDRYSSYSAGPALCIK